MRQWPAQEVVTMPRRSHVASVMQLQEHLIGSSKCITTLSSNKRTGQWALTMVIRRLLLVVLLACCWCGLGPPPAAAAAASSTSTATIASGKTELLAVCGSQISPQDAFCR
ncbi:unnamed protein product [Meganyctiphanes norvegica]|uniref:Uncharacterized protein n=1 Tax=Meganyctiphanes norvegica TaxID=48144 RepID=A0AAV2SBQ6_MEGNR